MLQLNPPLPFVTEDGRTCTAYFALDYSPDHATLFLCGFDDTRELWWLSQSKLHIVDNVTLDRPPLESVSRPLPIKDYERQFIERERSK